MSIISIQRGLDIPIFGVPSDSISSGKKIKTVAIVVKDYQGLKPSLLVNLGDQVKTGQVVIEDKVHPEIKLVAPASGKVTAVERGDKRVFLSLVIELNGLDQSVEREAFSSEGIKGLTRDEIKSKMLAGGLWPILIQRPFGIIADPEVVPDSIFVNAMDSNPLAIDPELVIAKNQNAFVDGLVALSRLTDGKVNLCKSPRSDIPHGESGKVINYLFEGPHPSGLTGTHIHFIDPIIDLNKKIWSVGYQDVISLGKYFTTGKFFTERYISLAGPQAKNPRIIKTIFGANLFDLTESEMKEGENRIISGSILHGTQADLQVGFLGPYANQVSVLEEDRERVFHGFMTPGFNKFSVKKIFASALNASKKFNFGTSTQGSHRDVVPIGSYEEVMPLDIIATFLVRSLLSDDLELAEKVGALELIEEDVALLTYACPGKNDMGVHLRKVLDQILKENF